MLKAIAHAFAAALARMGTLVWEVVREGGRSIMRLVARPGPAPSQDDCLAMEIEEARREARLLDGPETDGNLVRRYAAARMSDCEGPPIDRLPERRQRWLARLSVGECRILVGKTDTDIERHLDPTAWWIPGVQSLCGVSAEDLAVARDQDGKGGGKRPKHDHAEIRAILDELLAPSPGLRPR